MNSLIFLSGRGYPPTHDVKQRHTIMSQSKNDAGAIRDEAVVIGASGSGQTSSGRSTVDLILTGSL